MTNIKFKPRLTIIYEGKSEEYFFEKLDEYFEKKYILTKVKANGDTRIPLMYRKLKRKNNFSDIKIMIDLDGKKNIEDIIKMFKNASVEVDKKDIYFINPDIELLFIMCKLKVAKLKNNKTKEVIEEIYKFDSYDKSEKQLQKIMRSMTKHEIIKMFDLSKINLSTDDNKLKSTNYIKLFNDIYDIE